MAVPIKRNLAVWDSYKKAYSISGPMFGYLPVSGKNFHFAGMYHLLWL